MAAVRLLPAHEFVKLGTKPGMLIQDVLPVHSIMLISGEPFAGKSLVALAISLAIAAGRPFLGKQSRYGTVLYLGADSPRWDLALQLKKLARSARIEIDEDFPLHFFMDYDWRPLHDDKAANGMLKIVAETKADLLVLDTLRMVHLRDENHSGDMAAVMARARKIAEEGCSVLLLHHASKPQANDDGKSAGARSRGSGAIAASVDVHWLLQDKGEYTHPDPPGLTPGPRVEVKVAKGRGLGKAGRRHFQFGIVEPIEDQNVFLHRLEIQQRPTESKNGRFARLPGA